MFEYNNKTVVRISRTGLQRVKTKYPTLWTACMSHVPSIVSGESNSYVIILFLLSKKGSFNIL